MKLFLTLQSIFVVLAVTAAPLPDNSIEHLSKRADGKFFYNRGDTGALDALIDPLNDVCLSIPGGASHASNDCDATAFVFADGGCQQFLALVGTGGGFDETGPPYIHAYSVRFGSS
ncbi:hypothetical protein BGZ75_001102 [Mortierella antarctica]|nr:hypothetical protein BGZ75_001102 [Mortierella antarctica]